MFEPKNRGGKLKKRNVLNHHLYTWNPFVLYFGDLTLQNKVFSIQNRGHLGSRYIVIVLLVSFGKPKLENLSGTSRRKSSFASEISKMEAVLPKR